MSRSLTRKNFLFATAAAACSALAGASCSSGSDDDDDSSGAGSGSGGKGSGGKGSGGTGGTSGGSGGSSGGSGGSGGTGGSSGGSSGGSGGSGGSSGGSGGSGGNSSVTCSDVVAVISCNHDAPHELTIPVADVTEGVAKTYDITGQSDHAHQVDVTAADFTALKAGQSVFKFVEADQFQDHCVTLTCGTAEDAEASGQCDAGNAFTCN